MTVFYSHSCEGYRTNRDYTW